MIPLGAIQLMLDERVAAQRARARALQERQRTAWQADQFLSGALSWPGGEGGSKAASSAAAPSSRPAPKASQAAVGATQRAAAPTSQTAPMVSAPRPEARSEEPHRVLMGTTITGAANLHRTGLVEDQKRGKGRSPLALPVAPTTGGGGAAMPSETAAMLAAGYHPAVVKVVSFASGAARAAATAQYVERDGVELETDAGEILADKAAVAAEIKDWAATFSQFDPSQDVATVRLLLNGAEDTPEGRATLDEALHAAFAGHKFIYRIEARKDGTLEARAVVALSPEGRARAAIEASEAHKKGDVASPPLKRLSVRERRGGEDEAPPSRVFAPKSEALLKQRIVRATGIDADHIEITPTGTSHGKDGAAYRIEQFVARGEARTERGIPIANVADAANLARDWSHSLNSKAGRDTMHLILSAKAGTDHAAMTNAAREFLHDTFSGHKFMFALHTDKEADGHIHAHAIVAMKSETGEKLSTKKADLKAWRESFAEHARTQGLKIVATSAAERASSQSYGPRDKAIIDAADQPRPQREARDRAYAAANPRLIDNARQRIATARTNPVKIPATIRERQVVNSSHGAWSQLAANQPQGGLAHEMKERLALAGAIANVIEIIAKRVTFYETGGSPMANVSAEQMNSDLRAIDRTVASISEQLSGPTRQAFLDRSQPYLERLAARVDVQRAIEGGAQSFTAQDVAQRAGVAGDRIIADAIRLAAKDAAQAAQAERIAQSISASEIRDSGAPALTPTAQQDLVEERRAAALAQSQASAQGREADAAAEAARLVQQNPVNAIPQALTATDALQKIRLEQEALARQLDAEEGQKQRGQRMT